MNIQPSATLAIANLIKEKRDRGEEVFDLGVGEIIGLPSQEVADFVKNQLTQLAIWQYPAVPGTVALRQEAANWYNQSYDTTYVPANVLVTNGAKFAIFILLQILLQNGDEVLIPKPYWVSYPEMVKLFNGVPKFVAGNPDNGWKISITDLENIWTPKSKALILNNASNPAGTVYSETELKSILDWAADKKLIVIADEVYSDLVFDNNQKFFSCGAIKSFGQVIVVQSCSKNFALSGWRVGFIFADPAIIKQCSALQSQSTTGVAPICQAAALAALQARASIQENIKNELNKRRQILSQGLVDYFGWPARLPVAGLYLFISLQDLGVSGQNCFDFAQELLLRSNVAVVPGGAFGVPNYIRLSYGAPEKEIREGLEKLSLFIKNLFAK